MAALLSVAARMKIGSAIEEACGGALPKGWTIIVALEKDAGTVSLYDPINVERDFPSNHETLADEIRDAIQEARKITGEL